MRRAIETCCTIAWMALTQDMLRLTGDPEPPECLDLAYWNVILAPSILVDDGGRPPMNGSRRLGPPHRVPGPRGDAAELLLVNAPEAVGCSPSGPS